MDDEQIPKQIPGRMTIDEFIELMRPGTEEIAEELIADLEELRGE